MPDHEDDQGQMGKKELGVQWEVITCLVDRYPEGLSLPDLEAQVGDASGVKGAVEELIEVELLEREGDLVVPTLAARRGIQLLRLGMDLDRTE